jgi:hypothetical protein
MSRENLKFVGYREDKYYVSQCLNIDVASFGNTNVLFLFSKREAISRSAKVKEP